MYGIITSVCGCGEMILMLAFQAGVAGLIPATRTMIMPR